ncbi:uncharacterized protein N7487_011270 [Penicillium crustosum]|uniref:uncharacterized protein n=1 Tax=Penicillium crustosum TaxID=36656 RepID=UPI00239DA883|nr:uncharacterized protein N7487_011270 [Penicillium crustosum]KAJ5393629.1 hypothetical protein N7487_011270 [Penicillium crustosum]
MLIIIAAGADSEDTAAKVMSKQAVSVLLTLSRHPNVPVHTLANIHWGHGFGVSLVASSALEAYLLINLFDAVLSRKRLKLGVSTEKEVSLLETRCFQNFASKALSDYDYPAQNIIHRAFWNKMGVTDSWTYEQEKKGWAESGEQDIKGVIDPLRGENEKARLSLQRYLKSCFAILYIYDLLLREWHGDDGADQTWVSWIDYFFESFGHKR